MTGNVYVGTSGWHYRHWLGPFYPHDLPADQMLAFYAQHFDTVELNNTFYHLPSPTSFVSWRKTTPGKFVFAVKGSRFITHMKKLKDPESSVKQFLHGAERLETKLGPILFQLPPRWHVNTERLKEFLEALPKGHRYAFEFRDESWLVPEIHELLRLHNAAFCIHDLAGKSTPLDLTADFTYVRFHGPGAAKYAGSYSSHALGKWAERLDRWRKVLRGIYVYFNNDVGGHAVENARQLKRML